MTTVTHTPPVRTDKLCAVCDGPRVTTRNKAIDGNQTPNGIWLAHVEKDPFCSSTCARKFYGCELDEARLAA